MFFVELGARVVKIEPLGGDVTRSWRLPDEDTSKPASAYYHSINYGKESVFLDLQLPESIATIHELIKTADIFTANFKPGSAKKYSLDYQTLKDINQHIIYAQLFGFNKNSKRLAYDVVIQAESGFLSMTGTPDQELCKIPVALIDLIAGHHMKEAILLALLKRERFHKGSYIELSLLASGLSSLANQASNYLNETFIPRAMGTLHPNIAPYGEICITKDNERVILAIGSDNHFISLMEMLGLEEYVKQYATNHSRLNDRSSLHKLLSRAFLEHSYDHLSEEMTARKIPFGHIKNIAQAMKLAINEGLILQENGAAYKTISTTPFHIS